jgi:hypothetical protein
LNCFARGPDIYCSFLFLCHPSIKSRKVVNNYLLVCMNCLCLEVVLVVIALDDLLCKITWNYSGLLSVCANSVTPT